MRILAVIFGIVLIVLVVQDAFETIILPRRVTRRIRLARLFYRLSQLGWKSISHLIRSSAMRESFRGYVGPLTLLGLLVFWAVLFVIGFGLLLWGLALPLNAPDKAISFFTYLYLSGTTFFTLGLGDVTPLSGLGRVLVVTEVALGFIFLALVVSYVPILYQAFSRRELRISLLDARAGSPATAVELLRRNHVGSPYWTHAQVPRRRPWSSCVAIALARTSRNCGFSCTIGKCGAPTFWRVTSHIPYSPSTARNTSNNPGWKR